MSIYFKIFTFLLLITTCSVLSKTCSRYASQNSWAEPCSKTENKDGVKYTTLNMYGCQYSYQYCQTRADEDPKNGVLPGICKYTNEPKSLAYGGEDCSKFNCHTINIISPTSCINNKCVYQEENKTCTDHSECNIGYMCTNSIFSAGVCKKQVEENKSCVNSYQCLNSLVCLSGTCQKFFSKKEGERFNIILNDFNSNVACSHELWAVPNQAGYICQKIGYKRDNKITTDDFVECDPNDENKNCAVYDPKDLTKRLSGFSPTCNCSFGVSGKSYCPALNKLHPLYQDYYNFIGNTKADVHTLNRFDYLWKSPDTTRKLDFLLSRTKLLHVMGDYSLGAREILGISKLEREALP